MSFNGTADSGTVLSADVDDDGDLDLLTATSPANTVIWRESDGLLLDGGWTSHVVEDFFEGAVTPSHLISTATAVPTSSALRKRPARLPAGEPGGNSPSKPPTPRGGSSRTT